MFPFQSSGAEEMTELKNLVDKVLDNSEAHEDKKEDLAKQNPVKLGAPTLERAGLREPR